MTAVSPNLMLDAMSWKTTLFGLLAAIGGAVLAGISAGVIDASELPKWVKGVAGMLSVIGSAGVGLFARDNDKTSEDVKAANAGNVPIRTLLLLFAFALVCVLTFTGCAFNRQYATTTSTNPTNGVVSVTRAKSTTFALWDAKTVVDKTRATAGKTSSVGATGIDEGVSSSNTVNLVEGAIGAAVSAAVKSVAPIPK